MRTISAHALNPTSKARLLAMASEWDARAAAHDAKTSGQS
jgi:hypothetical protein